MAAPPSSPRVRALATAIRTACEQSGMSIREIGKRLGFSHAVLSLWQNGRRVPTVAGVDALLRVVGVAGEERDRIIVLARSANEHNWLPGGSETGMSQALAGVLDCEATAITIVQWTPTVIPGLLQTPGYASQMPGNVEMRMARRHVITRDQEPVEYTAYISQFAIEEVLGALNVHLAQLDHLIESASRSNITIRVVPRRTGWHPGLVGPFVIFGFADSPSIVHIEHYRSSVFLYESPDVETYVAASQAVRGKGMDPADSTEFIADVKKKMEM